MNRTFYLTTLKALDILAVSKTRRGAAPYSGRFIFGYLT